MAAKKNEILPSEERQLLQSVAAGDLQAFRLLVDHYWKRVYGNTLTLVKSPESAKEITQDIFLKIWKYRDRLGEVQGFKQYIYVIGRNQVISQLRKKLMESTREPEDILEDRLLPDQQLQYKETYGLIMKGIAQLTPQQQLIFKMSRMDGLSHLDIAKELGLSKNTVKGHMVLALNFLRTYVRDQMGMVIITLHLLGLMIREIFF